MHTLFLLSSALLSFLFLLHPYFHSTSTHTFRANKSRREGWLVNRKKKKIKYGTNMVRSWDALEQGRYSGDNQSQTHSYKHTEVKIIFFIFVEVNIAGRKHCQTIMLASLWNVCCCLFVYVYCIIFDCYCRKKNG